MTKILIVEDEKLSRTSMEKLFSDYGECQAVEKGIEGVSIFEDAVKKGQCFDIVILDISLDDMSGLDVLKKLRQIESENNIEAIDTARIIMATVNRELATVKESINAGCNDYIIKPLKADVVASKMTSLGFKTVNK